MKKIMSLFLTIALVIGILPVINIPIIFAEDAAVTSTSQDSSALWDWETYGDGVQLTKYKGTQTDVYVPSKVEKDGAEYSVIKLGDNLFKDNTAINSVTLGEGITEIGKNAFSGATNLVCIVTNQTLTTIGDSAFSGCTVFNSIILYDTVTNIGTDVFKNCTKVTVYCNESTPVYDYVNANNIPYKILNPDAEPEIVTVDGIEYYIMNGEAIAVSFDASATDVVIPATVNSYPVTELRETFKNNKTLISVSMPNSLKEIGDYAFYNCTALTSMNISDSVSVIGDYALYYCNSLKNISLSDNVKSIGNYAFVFCEKITEIELPDRLTNIGNYAFNYCSSLKSVNIPENVEIIGNYAFAYCSSLETVNISDKVSSIEAYTFYRCKSLKSVNIPGSIEIIGNYAFAYCSSLETVNIPNGIKIIYGYAFSNCTNLQKVKIPQSLTTIYETAFPSNTILIVYENSYAHTFAIENELLYFVTTGENEPEIYVIDGVNYFIQNGEAIAISFDKSVTKVEIPETVEGYPVTNLKDIFNNCTSLISVTLPKNLREIADYTFYKCKNITSINIPDSVTSIGNYAFSECTQLTNVKIGNSVKSIGNYAFNKCSKLTSISIPDSVIYIGTHAFSNCSSLKSASISKNVTKIEHHTFNGCSSLISVVIPEAATSIEYNAFYNCSALTDIIIPEGVTSIGTHSFENCSKLESVIIPNSVTTIWGYAFSGCRALTDVVISENLTSIGDYVFSGCVNLIKVKVPKSVKTMQGNSFPSNTILIVYENSYAHTFAKNNGFLYFLTTGENEPEIYKVDGITYLIEKGNAIVLFFDGSSTNVVIPETVEGYPVTEIREAFKGFTSIISVRLPDTLKNIGKYAFSDCTGLKSVNIPDSVTKIGEYAFSGCSGLTGINISKGVKSIGECAFEGCSSLTSLSIPDGVTSIGYSIFEKCTGLTTVTIGNGLTSISNNAFESCYNLKTVKIGNSVTSIGVYSFAFCHKLENVTIPNSVKSIGTCAFYTCIALKNISIPNSVTSIGDAAFSDCRKLESITIPDSVISIGNSVFRFCSSLVSVNISDSVRNIGESVFDSCSSLVSLTLPDSMTSIEKSLFNGCSSLKSIIIPDNVTSIEYNAFASCTSLTNLIIPYSVKKIGNLAFSGCSNLKMIKIPENVTSMQATSFPNNVILLVHKNSYAHTFAVDNDLLFFVLHKTENPEISYGAGITGTATYTDGTAVSGATVEILYDDGTVKESVTTDETGAYSFTYAEVGRYTIRVTDASGNTGSEVVSVKRMNVFDVYLAGETDIVIKKGYTVSGTVSPTTATITLTDSDGNVISSTETSDGTYSIVNVPNGTYILKAETEKGTATKEITVFNGDVSVDKITVASESAAVTGYVEVEDREFKHHKRNWVNITIYNEDGMAVASQKSDKDGNYAFTNLPLGEYSIVAETNEMRPDKKKGFDRSHKLTGYAYVNITEAKTYSDVNIVLYEENDYTATISGKVTAKGETQDCELILTNVFKHEIARYETGKNGKYTFKNIPDGLYFITAITKSDGMGFAVVVVHNGKVYGDTDITISKPQKFYDRETKMNNDIPHCNNRDDALKHRERIAEEKRYYDGLSPKEKKHFSKEYVERLNRLCEWIADSSYTSIGDVVGRIENEGTIISGDELDAEEKIEFVLNISETSEHTIPDDGIKTREEFEQQSINDTAGDKHIAKYYDISLSKNGKSISNVQKHTDTTGKLRITMEIPEEYRGHKHYSFVHMHNGEPTTLVDLDDNPNTVTFEVDKFSTFALTYSDVELTETSEYPATITYDEATGKITVSSSQAGTLYIATFDGARFVSVEKDFVYAETPKEYDFKANQAAFIWDDNMTPLSKRFEIEGN